MVKRLKPILILNGLLLLCSLQAQNSSFLDKLRIGFGGGANMAHVIDLEPYQVYEDLLGEDYKNTYSTLFGNLGNQYFVQIEWFHNSLILVLKPGTYTYRFQKEAEVLFDDEAVEQVSPYILRYMGIPLEVRYNLDLQRFRPYLGAAVSYAHRLGSLDASSETFIRSKFSAGAVAGTYIDLRYVILDLNLAYQSGLHNITRKRERFAAGSGSTFAQDDILLNGLQLSLSLLFSLQKQKHYSNVECFY